MAAVTICSDFGAQENKVCHDTLGLSALKTRHFFWLLDKYWPNKTQHGWWMVSSMKVGIHRVSPHPLI